VRKMSAFDERPPTPYVGRSRRPTVDCLEAIESQVHQLEILRDDLAHRGRARESMAVLDQITQLRAVASNARRGARASSATYEEPMKGPTSKRPSPALVWDFTLWLPEEFEGEFLESEEFLSFQTKVQEVLDRYCQDWVYQLEQAGGSEDDEGDETDDSDSEYHNDLRFHFQGRFRLKTKNRLTALKKYFKDSPMSTAHLSVTSRENWGNNFYVTKEDTRKGGPWFSESYSLGVEDSFVPRQVKEKMSKLFPWQQFVLDDCRKWCPRTINVIVDRKGNCGKSSFISYMLCMEKNSLEVPPVHDFKDVTQFICSSITQKGRKCCKNIFVDFPRSRDQTKIHQFMAGIERIKDGRVFDSRYKATTVLIDSPNIWMFTNIVLKLDYVSYDRWKFFTIDKSKEIQPLDFAGMTSQEDLDNHVAFIQGLEAKPPHSRAHLPYESDPKFKNN